MKHMHAIRRRPATPRVCLMLIVWLLAGCSIAMPAAPLATPVPIRAVYLVTGPGVLAPSEVAAHPEILLVHSFDELAAHAHSPVALWIDKSAAPFAKQSWLNESPQAWYPMVLVGYNNTLYSFREMLGLCCFAGPIVDWSTVKLEPGFSVIQRQDGPLPQATYLQGYAQVPTAGDILTITDALLDGRLQATPTPELVVGASATPPPAYATDVVATSTPFVPPGLTAQVELDVFSGRPNPAWPLSGAQIDALRSKLAALPTAAAQPYPDRLGYRGLIVTFTERSGGALPTVWRVWGGVAQITSGTAIAYYADPNQGLERWLLQTGQPYLPADLFATVQADMSGTPPP